MDWFKRLRTLLVQPADAAEAKTQILPSTRTQVDGDQAAMRLAAPEPIAPGYLLNQRYQIEKELGHGGVGVVYLARDTKMHDRPVVIKVLLDQITAAANYAWFAKKFGEEIKALARIDHPGIVGVFDASQTADGKAFIVMQFIAGSNLRTAMGSGGMDRKRVAALVRQMGQALSAAHDKGVIHRDLKPENIMLQLLDGAEHVKLIDFGIATIKDSTPKLEPDDQAEERYRTMIAGTGPYMAPEQFRGEPTSASDIYALGVIAYEMLTGEKPFDTLDLKELRRMQREGLQAPATAFLKLPIAAQKAIRQALSFDSLKRQQSAKELGENLFQALTAPGESTATMFVDASSATALRVALLYKRHALPDEELLNLLETRLTEHGYRVFIDRHLTIGVEWAKEIERQVRTADAVIPLLSAASVTSEMLAYEVQIAHEAAQQHQGKPRLLPVRVNYGGALPDPLNAVLARIQQASWRGAQDNDSLLGEILDALIAAPDSQSRRRKLEPVGGAVPLSSQFYIERPTDVDFQAALERRDSLVLVKGARQMGKTSLLARGLQQTRAAGARVVLTDFQKLNAEHLVSAETLFLTLGEWIAEELNLPTLPDQDWQKRRGASRNFELYLKRHVLGQIAESLVWGLDEVDRLFTCPFASEVFGLFRSWHNERATNPDGPLQRLTMAIAYATEAHLFITDLNQSPFNVGTRLALSDFTFEQVAELNRRYSVPLRTAAEIERFTQLVGGQPYLVRRGLHEMASSNLSLNEFVQQADRDEGPFGDHLRRMLVLLAQDAGLCEIVRAILRGQPCATDAGFYRLRSAGVMTGDSRHEARPRCELYARYLTRHLL